MSCLNAFAHFVNRWPNVIKLTGKVCGAWLHLIYPIALSSGGGPSRHLNSPSAQTPHRRSWSLQPEVPPRAATASVRACAHVLVTYPNDLNLQVCRTSTGRNVPLHGEVRDAHLSPVIPFALSSSRFCSCATFDIHFFFAAGRLLLHSKLPVCVLCRLVFARPLGVRISFAFAVLSTCRHGFVCRCRADALATAHLQS